MMSRGGVYRTHHSPAPIMPLLHDVALFTLVTKQDTDTCAAGTG